MPGAPGIKMCRMKPNQDIRILTVDDNIENLQVLGSLLHQMDYRVAIAQSGNEALRMLPRVYPDLILLDIMMPGMDGYQTLEKIKELDEWKAVPVIFLTAKHSPEDIVKGFELGAVDYITKPFNKSELTVRIRTHLQLRFIQRDLEDSQKQLKENIRLKDKLFSIISHDLRSPISGVHSLLARMEPNTPDGDYLINKHHVSLMRNALKNTFNLLENLLLWSREQRNKLQIAPQDIALRPVAEETLELLLPMAKQKNVRIHNNIPGHLHVKADISLLAAVIRNLLSNSIKFSHPGGEIILQTEVNDHIVRVCVVDKGVGMTHEEIRKILSKDKFHSRAGTDNEGGSGIGLKLVSGFVRKLGGELSIESQAGEGTTICFDVPEVIPE